MILSENIEKNYSFSKEKIQSAKTNSEKNIYLKELIGNLIKSGISFSVRELSKILKVSRELIKKIQDAFLSDIKEKEKIETRGRKKIEDKNSEIIRQIEEICKNCQHVDRSMKDRIIYIDITLSGIKEELKKKYNYSIEDCPCENTIRRILIEKLKYKITKVKKSKVYTKIPETNMIFENVFLKLDELENSDKNTIGISIDDKASKYVGLLSGNGSSWIEKHALDHDTNPLYVVKPFGIMDLKTKKVQVYCTTNNSTADFKVDCVEEYLKQNLLINSNINKMLIFLDNGPENSSRRKLWKYRIIELAIKYHIEIELVYYPPYHSKYNKIEHFWGVLQRHWNGLIIDDLDKLIGAINSTKWDGENAEGILTTKVYEKGKKIDEDYLKELEEKHICYRNEKIKKWSFVVNL